ncbi:cysteine hydrolase [Paenibacillus urinalis]|uniref:Cysteine hydrolase n=1 Tax=Paenibacillus urinalis TaxID=521520 RepID=A0AAX3MTC4_9BACL|nr:MULTISPECIES: isochorismatase family cysteine hydrolase [Paenibacillus]WDH80638.1 cysteine hydrolase [Paenibacillus urinalis]WDH96690.1 cysteine hydrolase [Paenibacillus urinalis]WDI00334.1 cysteine hydrolase [Paenibacillus urinalis]GAK40846.1 isochorismatase hydrolase [Paenibacillus sp. TCA20]
MSVSQSKSALLVMDMQNNIVSRYVSNNELLYPFQQAVEAARRSDIMVIYAKVSFRSGYPEISPRNKMFGAIRARAGAVTVSEAMDIHEAVTPLPKEPVVTKLRVSAFAGSDLDIILRSNQIDTLILTGIATSGVVLSTLREAADKDYTLKVLSDACIDADEEVHRVLMEKVFPHQAEVLTVKDWVNTIR